MMRSFSWTPEIDEQLIRLLNEGLSATQIAARLGAASRSAVCGRVARLRRAGKLQGFLRVEKPKIVKLPKQRAAPSVAVIVVEQRTPGLAALPMPRREPDEVQSGAQLTALRSRKPAPYEPGKLASILDVTGCRFPVKYADIIGGHLFCNGLKDDGPYCSHHAARAFASQPPKKALKPSHVYTARR